MKLLEPILSQLKVKWKLDLMKMQETDILYMEAMYMLSCPFQTDPYRPDILALLLLTKSLVMWIISPKASKTALPY